MANNRYLKDPRAVDVIQAAMKLAGWHWATYPIMGFGEAPKVEIALIDRPATVSLGSG
jgi:CO/xanthine dehydrogenase Mo-binding subunit